MAGNPKNTFKNKPTFAVRAHATMRLHDKRIEIGFRIPPGMEEHLFRFLWTKPHLRALVSDKAKAAR
jgi:hypothetical protein